MKRFFIVSAFLSLLVFWSSVRAASAEISIDAEFPGGNILVDSIQDGVVHVRPDQRDSNSNWFYYAFRVKNADGQTIRFVFDQENRVGARGPAVSSDQGKTWRYLSDQPGFSSREFVYSFGPEETSVLFALAIPYTQKDWDEFTAPFRTREDACFTTLCKSRKGRDVELLRIGKSNPNARFAVVLTARHHCCEMIASMVLEGILQEVFSDSPSGKWLRENAEFFVVPFTDKDGVEDGDQGKGRVPHDHNRDYNHEIYPEIRAIKAQTCAFFSSKPLFFMDLHCPWIRSGMNEFLYSPMSSIQKMTDSSTVFFKKFEEYQQKGAIPYSSSNNLPFGQAWNTVENYVKFEDGRETAGSKMWAGQLPNAIFAGTIEMPFSNSSGVEVTRENSREVGRNLAKTMADFLKQCATEPAAVSAVETP